MKNSSKIKEAPNSKESEMMVLGCMLTSSISLNIAADSLDETDFYYTEHQILFQALKASYKQNKPADIHIICEELKRQNKLDTIGGTAYVTTLAQYAGTSAYIEEYADIIKSKSTLRRIIQAAQNLEKTALDEPPDVLGLLDEFQTTFKNISLHHGDNIPIVPIDARKEALDNLLSRHRGKKYLGLCVKTIEDINDKLSGLRKLILLAAAPNVGKTAITIQLATEALQQEPDACLIYISLEMSELEIFTRMHLYLSGLNFNTFVFGSKRSNGEVFYNPSEHEQLQAAKKVIDAMGNRIQIIDSSTCPSINSRLVINYIEHVKTMARCTRAIVIVDYLQVWPVPQNMRFTSDIEVDKWRIGEIKKIRDALQEDPIIVISEARKPSGSQEKWGSDLADIMGSARGAYTPDVAMFLLRVSPASLAAIWKKNNFPEPKIESANLSDSKNDEKTGLAIKEFLAIHGISICKLDVPKGRDGMEHFSLLLEFHFRKNTFQKIDLKKLNELTVNHNTLLNAIPTTREKDKANKQSDYLQSVLPGVR